MMDNSSFGCNIIRAFTQYVTPSMMKEYESVFHGSMDTLYTILDDKSNTISAYLSITPDVIQTAAAVHPLLYEMNNNTMIDDYQCIFQSLLSYSHSPDVIWIQSISNVKQLQIIIDCLKNNSNEKHIWISIDIHHISDLDSFFNELFSMFSITNDDYYSSLSLIAVGHDFHSLNASLIQLSTFCQISGGTKFGAIIDDLNNVMGDMKVNNEWNETWNSNSIEITSNLNSLFTEYSDDILSKICQFWFEKGLDIIGCEWESGMKVLKLEKEQWMVW